MLCTPLPSNRKLAGRLKLGANRVAPRSPYVARSLIRSPSPLFYFVPAPVISTIKYPRPATLVAPNPTIHTCVILSIPSRFGDVAHAPPDLAKIPKPRGFKYQGQAKPWARQATATGGVAGGGGGGGGASGGVTTKKSKKGNSAGGGGGGKDAEDGGEEEEEQRQEQRQMEADAKKAQKRQMEEMRLRVQEAYSGLKKKRRAGQTQFVGSDL